MKKKLYREGGREGGGGGVVYIYLYRPGLALTLTSCSNPKTAFFWKKYTDPDPLSHFIDTRPSFVRSLIERARRAFHVTSSPPCWWTVNKRSLFSSLCLSTCICLFHHCYLCLPRFHENHVYKWFRRCVGRLQRTQGVSVITFYKFGTNKIDNLILDYKDFKVITIFNTICM